MTWVYEGWTKGLTFWIAFAAAASFFSIFSVFNARTRWLPFYAELRMNYFFMFLALPFLFGVIPYLHHRFDFEAPIKIWAAQSMWQLPAVSSPYQALEFNMGTIAPAGIVTGASLEAAAALAAMVILMAALWSFLKFVREVRRLRVLTRGCLPFRSLGCLRIGFHSDVETPISFALGRQAWVLMPESIAHSREQVRVAVLHEMQHHRQGDLKMLYAIAILRIILPLNPGHVIWGRSLQRLQEFACDERLIELEKVSPQVYARCLIRAAENLIGTKDSWSCATGLSFALDQTILKRRILKMFNHKYFTRSRKTSKIASRFKMVAVSIVALGFASTLTLASQNWIEDRRITREEAQKLADHAQSEHFNIIVNDEVLKELNRFLGTREGRQYFKQSLQRMDSYRAMIQEKADHYGVPSEVIAMPIIESGYQNLSPQGKVRSSGIWMFIPETAKNFGLKDRQDAEAETDAAMRLLVANRMQLQDWNLAVLAFNCGASKVVSAIQKTGSRDIWDLIHAGATNDKNYYARSLAAMIILKNPKALD